MKADENEIRYVTTVAEIAEHPLGPQTMRLGDVLNAKTSALLTHVSIMIAVSTAMLFFSRGPEAIVTSRLLLIEIALYASISLLCIYTVRITGPNSFKSRNGDAVFELVSIVRRRRNTYNVALMLTVLATISLIMIMFIELRSVIA